MYWTNKVKLNMIRKRDTLIGGAYMDIAALSMSLANEQLSTQVGVAVMKLVKDQSVTLGQDLIQDMKQMELSVNPNVGSQIDMRI